MRTLEEFKKERPSSWDNFSASNKILTILYLHKEGVSESTIKRELSDELNEMEFEKGLEYLKKMGEIECVEESGERRYYLEKKTREAFGNLYDKRG